MSPTREAPGRTAPTGFVAAIEGGGSRTRGWLVTGGRPDPSVVAAVDGGPSNLHALGPESLSAVLVDLVRRLLARAGLGVGRVRAMALGMAGAGTETDGEVVRRALVPLGLACTPLVVSDARAALVGAVGARPGVVVIAGTGSMALGIGSDGIEVRAGGFGHVAGDEGSGFDLGRRALALAGRVIDGREPPAPLVDRLMVATGCGDHGALARWIRRHSCGGAESVGAVASLARVVTESAQAGDPWARAQVEDAARALAAAARTVALRLRIDRGPVVLHGGLVRGSATVREEVRWALADAGLTDVIVASEDAALDGLVRLAWTTGPSPPPNAPPRGRESPRRGLARTVPPGAVSGGPAGMLGVTERPNEATRDIDLLTPLEVVDLICREDATVPAAVHACRDAIARAVEAVIASLAARARGEAAGRLVYVGAGTSGRLGVLDAAECPPTFSTKPGMVIGVIAGGDRALRRAAEGAEDDPNGGRRAMDDLSIGPRDTVCGITASGRTPYVVGALHRAKARGARTVLVTTNRQTSLAIAADIVIAPEVGPEVIAGSTRLKSGTATKLVLNTITTAALSLSGKVYSNLMVDLRPGSFKLVERGLWILRQLLGVEARRARALFSASGRQVKVALLMGWLGLSAAAARRLLGRHGGFLRRALAQGGRRSVAGSRPSCKEET